jgi:hypothetical protein
MNDEYVTMRDIRKAYGISSHKVGKELKDSGYRDHGGQPTKKAYGLQPPLRATACCAACL